MADTNQLELALLNLAVNARDAMPEGGRLSIRLDAVAPGEVAGLPGGAACYLRLRVADTGTGMDAATLARAVEPFFSTKPVGQGTGLGLSMAHGVARQLGGDLRLSSVPGQGTTAELLLPAATGIAGAPVASAEVAAGGATDPAPPSRILVVDDDPLIIRSTADMLEDLGHSVLEADCGAKALAILAGGAPVDLLVTDYAMPGMTGLEVAVAAQRLRPGLQVVLASGFVDLASGVAPSDLPRLTKPYRQEELATVIDRMLAAGGPKQPVAELATEAGRP